MTRTTRYVIMTEAEAEQIAEALQEGRTEAQSVWYDRDLGKDLVEHLKPYDDALTLLAHRVEDAVDDPAPTHVHIVFETDWDDWDVVSVWTDEVAALREAKKDNTRNYMTLKLNESD